jgi:hypothetical protein
VIRLIYNERFIIKTIMCKMLLEALFGVAWLHCCGSCIVGIFVFDLAATVVVITVVVAAAAATTTVVVAA